MIVELFSRPGCHLCEEARKVVLAAARVHTFQFVERNVEESADWERQFGQEIPVVFIDGHKAFKCRVNPAELDRSLRAPRRPAKPRDI